jgi:hypothetical protein
VAEQLPAVQREPLARQAPDRICFLTPVETSGGILDAPHADLEVCVMDKPDFLPMHWRRCGDERQTNS